LSAVPNSFQLGLDTFGDLTFDANGALQSAAHSLRDVISEAVLAEQVGVDAFAVGEHHRPDFAISAPEVMLAAIAAKTERVLLGSAVTVLSTDDPVRVFERFSTLNAISNGRAEVILGRGSFTESYPLFGYDLAKYTELFEDKLALFAQLLLGGPVTWSGRSRSPLTNQVVYPTIENGRLRTWVGVGGSPESVVRAARYGLPLTLAIIGGNPHRFRPYVDLFHQSLAQFGQPPLPVAVHSPGYVADTDEEAKNDLWPHYAAMMTRIGSERGWPPASRAQFDHEAGPHGALCVGSPDTVARKIANTSRHLGLSRFNMKYSNGTLPHDKLLRSIELFGTQVAPRVRELVQQEVAPRNSVHN
jgi:probable LLM family oxidoreductase